MNIAKSKPCSEKKLIAARRYFKSNKKPVLKYRKQFLLSMEHNLIIFI